MVSGLSTACLRDLHVRRTALPHQFFFFAQRVAREVKARLGWACELKLAKQEDFSEPLNRTNTEPAAKLMPDWNEIKAWDTFVEFYAK